MRCGDPGLQTAEITDCDRMALLTQEKAQEKWRPAPSAGRLRLGTLPFHPHWQSWAASPVTWLMLDRFAGQYEALWQSNDSASSFVTQLNRGTRNLRHSKVQFHPPSRFRTFDTLYIHFGTEVLLTSRDAATAYSKSYCPLFR
jgi:hypothetical protein